MRNMSPSSGNLEATFRRLSSIQSLAAVTNVEPMHHRCVFALRESPVSATLGAQAVVAGSDPQKTGTGDVTIAGLQSAAGMSGNKMRFRLHWGHRSPGSRRIQESSRDTSSNKKYQCSSNTPQKGCNKRGAHEHVARLGRVVTNVEPSHWRLVGDDGLVFVSSIQSVSRNLGAAVRNMSRSLAAQKTNSSRSKSTMISNPPHFKGCRGCGAHVDAIEAGVGSSSSSCTSVSVG